MLETSPGTQDVLAGACHITLAAAQEPSDRAPGDHVPRSCRAVPACAGAVRSARAGALASAPQQRCRMGGSGGCASLRVYGHVLIAIEPSLPMSLWEVSYNGAWMFLAQRRLLLMVPGSDFSPFLTWYCSFKQIKV